MLLVLLGVTAWAGELKRPSPNTELRALQRETQRLWEDKHLDEAILHLQRQLATAAAKKPGTATLATTIELLGSLAFERAEVTESQPWSGKEATRLYHVAGSLFARALALRESLPNARDEDIGRLFFRMQQAASATNRLSGAARGDAENLPPAGEGSGMAGLGIQASKSAPKTALAADASGGTTFCVLQCDPELPPDRATMDPVDAQKYREAVRRLEQEAQMMGAVSREGAQQLVRARKKREALAAAYAARSGERPFETKRANGVTVAARACDAVGCHSSTFADVVSTAPQQETGAVGVVLGGPMYDASPRVDWGAERERAEQEAAARRAQAAAREEEGARQSGVEYKKHTVQEFKEEVVAGDLLKPVERFPTLEAPDQVDAGVEFAVQVSLTEEQLTPEAKITGGKQTTAGKLEMSLPAASEQWDIDVALSTTGLDVVGGNNLARITLPRAGDSTVAMFRLRARPAASDAPARVMATLWHAGSYLGKVVRMISVGRAAPPSAQNLASTNRQRSLDDEKPAAKEAPAASATAAKRKAPATTQRATAAVDLAHQAADLTVYIVQVSPDTSDVLIDSPYLQPSHFKVPRNAALGPWLRTEYAELVRRGGRSDDPAVRLEAAAFLRGFGRQVYQQFAPAPFKQAFWKLADKLGPRFHSIQIFTDDPALPWELMRPVREDGSGERDFLGVEFAVARWHITEDTRQYDSPPQVEAVRAIVVIAPNYDGDATLAAQVDEVGTLAKLSGYEALPGSLASVRTLLRELPQGIVHFAGHGRARQRGGGVQYAIQLEDGVLDLMTWRGLVEAGQPNHPVFFMNACEVGGANQVGNFVDGWAPEVLRTGASGYIGALWKVDDAVAADFASSFYRNLEQEIRPSPAIRGQGVNVGALLARTRREVFARTGSPTALAYVFYGDVNLKLVDGVP